jgi:cutinase
VTYSAALNSQSAREGVDNLNRLIRDQRNACQGQHAKIVGYSEGAAVAHIWVTENWQTFGNVNAVLIADPKRAPEGHGSGGFAGIPGSGIVGYPLAGVDNFYGNVPTVTICTDDVICDSTAPSGWLGYYPGTNHSNYNFDVNAYSDNGNGQWFYGQFFPR